mgnify:CR=1 FL=1|jgi:hypothetical protein
MALSKVVNNSIESVDAAKLSGTIADARFPATLPAISGANLTNMASGGAWNVLSSGTFSSVSSVDITGITKTTRIIISCNSSTSDWMRSRFSTDNGTTFESGNLYSYAQISNAGSSSASIKRQSQNDPYFYTNLAPFTGNDVEKQTFNYDITIYDPADTAAYTGMFLKEVAMSDHLSTHHTTMTGFWRDITAVNAFSLYRNSGSISGSYVATELN